MPTREARMASYFTPRAWAHIRESRSRLVAAYCPRYALELDMDVMKLERIAKRHGFIFDISEGSPAAGQSSPG